jgi:hypothetical protein
METKIPFKNIPASVFWKINQQGDKQYNTEKIIEQIKHLEGKNFAREVCSIIQEDRFDIVEKLLLKLGKEMLIAFIEKALTIQNEGGVSKNPISIRNEICSKKKTAGGVLFQLIKFNGGLSKPEIKQIFTHDYKARRDKKRMLKMIDQMLIME